MRLASFLILCCLALQWAVADDTNLTLTVDWVIYSNVTFGTVTATSVAIRHSSGIARLPLSQLPPAIQTQLGYDPQKAAVAVAGKRRPPERRNRRKGLRSAVWPKNGRDTTRYRWLAGIAWQYWNKCPAMFFYLWSRGGMSGEKELAKIFGKRAVYRSNELDDWDGGCVILAEIPITLDDRKNFEVDRDRIVAEVRKILKTIRKTDMQKMFAS